MPDAIPTISDSGQLTERELFHQWLNPESKARQFDAGPTADEQRSSRARAVTEFNRDVPPVSGTAFGRNVAKGFLNVGETSLGFFEALSDILGAKGAKAFYKEKGDQLDELNKSIPVEIQSVTDIGSLADAGGYAAMAIGQLAPQIATSLIGGLGARAITASRGPLAQLAASVAGAVVPATVQESGGIYRGTREETGVEAPFTSLALGSISGALEAVTPARFLLKVFGTGADELKKKVTESLLKQTAKEILKSGATEFGTEAAQEAIQIGANKFADSTYEMINAKNAWRVLDAGLMGLVGGAALGSVEPSIEHAIKYIKQEESNAVDQRKEQTSDSGERGRTAPQIQTDGENRQVTPAVDATGATAGGGSGVQPVTAEAEKADVAPVVETGQTAQSEVVQKTGPLSKELSFAERSIPKLDARINDLHNLLIDSGAFGASEFYDRTFPIPREGGIVSARLSDRYRSDPVYAAKVNASIKDITDTMVAANRQRMTLMDKPISGEFGVRYAIEKARATYGVNVIRAWNNEAKQKYPYTQRLGNISIRESFQNSLDAVMAAIQNRQIKKGEIKIDSETFGNKGFRVEDNGIGMSDTDIGQKFLSLHSTGKAVEGRFGGSGIAKAVILGPADSATWTLRTRDNAFNNELAQANEIVHTVPFKQGTEIEVKTDKYIIDDDARRYVESTELPKNVTVTYNGNPVKNPFHGKKSVTQRVTVNPQTHYDLTWYPRPPEGGYNQKYLIRLVDAKTGAKLTQAIKDVGNEGFSGTIVVDITTTATPGSDGYPLVDSRMELKWGSEKPVSELVSEKSVDPLSAGRVGMESKFQRVSERPEWKATLGKLADDERYMELLQVIQEVWESTGHYFGSYPLDYGFTPLELLNIKIDTGFSGYRGGTMFQAKHLAAYESVSRLMAQPAGAKVTEFYGMLSKPSGGSSVNAEHAAGGVMGLNFLNIDKTALKNPVSYALYLRDLVAHELTHDFYGPHNEEFTSKEIQVQRDTAHLFPDILRIAEAVLGESSVLRKSSKPTIRTVERIVEKRVDVPFEVPVEVTTIVEKYLPQKQLQFIYDNAENQPTGKAKDDLYYPRQAVAQDLWAEPIRSDQRNTGLSGASENAGVGRGAEQSGPPSHAISEPGGLGAGAIGVRQTTGITSAQTDQTLAEFKARVTASNLSPEAKAFINAFLDSKAAKYLEGARFRIAEALDNGWQGSYWQGLIQLAETAAPGVAPQEFMHRIFDLLPERDKQTVAALRQDRLVELKAQFPNDPLLASIAEKPVSTTDFVAANPTDQQITDFYPVANNDEFFAHMMSDKFTGAVKNKPTLTLVGKLREVLKDVIAAIKKAFKLPVTADQMFRNILNGRYEVRPQPLAASPAFQALRLEGVSESDARELINGIKTVKQVVDGNFKVTPAFIPSEGQNSQFGHDEAFAQGYKNAIARLTEIIQPRGAVLPITRKETIEKVAAFAKPGELPTEALLATGQVTSPRNILERVMSALPAALREKVGQLILFKQMDDISQFVQSGLGVTPVEYATARATLPDEGLKNVFSVHSNRRLELLEQTWESVRKKTERQEKYILSPAFAAKFRSLFKLKTREESLRDARQAIELTIKNGLDKAIRRVREAGANDALFESAENERLFYESLTNRTNELLSEMQAIVQGPTFPGTLATSATPTATEILTHYYQAVPRPAPNSVTGRNERAAVQRVAAEILSRSLTLRQRMLAAVWGETAALSAPITNLEEQVVRDIQTKNPATVIGKLVREAGNLNRAEGRAAFVFLQKHREVTRKLQQLNEFQAAVSVIDAVLMDPEYRALRTQVATDAKAEVRPVGAQGIELGTPFYSTAQIYLPSGEIITVNMFPDKVRFENELTNVLGPALDEINSWLLDSANQDNPARFFYQSQYNRFKALWWSSSALKPSKQLTAFRNTVFKFLDSFLGLLGPMLKSIGTRDVILAKTSVAVWKDTQHQMNDWLAKWNPRVVEANGKAAKSHPDIWDVQDRGSAVNEWHDKVFTPLAASRQDPARRGYNVGDVIPESGETVTDEDMAALQLQSTAGREAYGIDITKGRAGIPLPHMVKDTFVPGAKFFRTPIAATSNVVTRRFSSGAVNIANAFITLSDKIKGFPEGLKIARLFRFWTDHFVFVKSAVANRNAQHSNLTDFESSLEAATPEIANGNISNIAELIDFVHSRSAESPEAIADWLFGELERHAKFVAGEVKEAKDLGFIAFENVEDANPFTVGRGVQGAPPAWYSYGFSDSRSIYNFSMSGSNFYFETMVKSLNAVKESLAAESTRMQTELNRLTQTMGKGKAETVLRKQNQDDIRLGKQTAEYEQLQDFQRGLQKMIGKLTELYSPGGKRLEEDFGHLNKLWGIFIGDILSSTFTLARNAFEGGFIHNGFLMSRLFGSTLTGFPRAFFGEMQSLIKIGASGLLAVPKAALKLHPIRGVSKLISSGNLIEAERTVFGEAMTELATNMFERVQMYRDLEAAGLGMPSYPSETLAASAQFPLTYGQITERPYANSPFGRLLQSIGPALFTFADAQLSLFIRPFLPRLGDQIANLAVANTSLGAIHTFEARLRKLFSVYRAAGISAASLKGHIFTPSEVLGKWFGLERTQTSLTEIEDWFSHALIPFHDSVAAYFERLEADPSARWLTPEEKMRLVVRNVERVNAATPENRALIFRKNLPMRIVGGLLGWNIGALREDVNFFTGVAASDKNYSRVQLRIAVSMLFLASLAWSALGQAGIEEILRFLSRVLNDEERPTRQPWEYESTGDESKAWSIYAFNSIPFVATALNVAFSDLPNKAGFSPTLLAQQKVIDVLNYMAGAIRTRDITYRLPQLVRGFLPLAPILLNRLPSTEGTVEALNVRRLYTRYGDQDLIRKSQSSGPGLGSTATPLTPYGDRIMNALAKGDYEAAEAIKAQAVKVARELGKADPEKSVEQMIVSRLPTRRAFKETLNQTQMARVMGRMSPGERQQVDNLNATLQTGLGRLGIKADLVEPEKPERLALGGGGGSGIRSLRSSAFGRRSRRPRLIGLAGRRSRRLGRSRRRSRLGALV